MIPSGTSNFGPFFTNGGNCFARFGAAGGGNSFTGTSFGGGGGTFGGGGLSNSYLKHFVTRKLQFFERRHTKIGFVEFLKTALVP
jgi:hypothetical protein